MSCRNLFIEADHGSRNSKTERVTQWLRVHAVAVLGCLRAVAVLSLMQEALAAAVVELGRPYPAEIC
jgi:hypothetical protein